MAVHFGRRFSVVDHTRHGVLGLDLCENQGRKDSDLENDEDSVLQGLARIIEVEISKTGQEGDDNVVEKTSEAIVGRAPEGEVGPQGAFAGGFWGEKEAISASMS